MLCRFRAFEKLFTKELLTERCITVRCGKPCILRLFFSWNFALFWAMCVKRIFWNFWQHKVQFLLEANKMLSYLGFDARQSSMAVQFELKSFSLLFKPRDIISILPTSFFSVPTVSYGLGFVFRSDLRPKREGKKTHSAIILKEIFGHVIPTSREKNCLSSKSYVILNVIPSEIYVRSFTNSEKWHMVKKERLFPLTFFRKWREHFVFFVWLRATRQPIPTKLTFYRRGRVWQRALVG